MRTPRRARGGSVLATAIAYAVTALLLVWLAINSLTGPYAGTPRRQVLAIGSIALATAGFGVSIAVVVGAIRRRRRLQEHMRVGEQIVGTFPAELLDLADDGSALRARHVGITLTNQRLLVHEPENDPDPSVSLEHEQIDELIDRGPTPSPRLRRCILYEMHLADGTTWSIRMDAGTSIDFRQPRGQYLDERKREVRALILEAHGPTPSRPAQSLDRILTDGRPTVCLLELDENYLRVIGEHSPPMADLYYYFHWEHMDIGPVQPVEVPGLPENWRKLRIYVHGNSSLTLCGSEQTMRRVREKGIAGGAAPAEESRSPIGSA
jgi:hypothetical protein